MMTATAARRAAWLLGAAAVSLLTLPWTVSPAHAIALDDRGEMTLGLRAYTAVRVGTETIGNKDNPLNFPRSDAGHVRQDRYFLELRYDHDLKRLANTGWGLASLFRFIKPTTLMYSLTYRGEGEGIYDFGPDEYSHPFATQQKFRLDLPSLPPLVNNRLPVKYEQDRVHRLRTYGRQRHRLFLAYLDFEKGPFFTRIGRQVLAWGETDVFRLLDNINPLDDSFGGFFIALDERRVPINMVRSSWNFGDLWKVHDSFLEGFVAQGKKISQDPGIPAGSPWSPGGIGRPNPSIRQIIVRPDNTDIRGGFRFVGTVGDVTTTLAHYWTYLDIPTAQYHIPGPGGKTNSIFPTYTNQIQAYARFPRVPITGASITFPVERFYSIVRSEAAMFWGEPMNRQGASGNAELDTQAAGTKAAKGLRPNIEGGLDPFAYPAFGDVNRKTGIWGTGLQRDTFNYAVGLDINRFVRWLNPQQTVFISTQFFYKHVFDSPGDLVLPTPFRNIYAPAAYPVAGSKVCETVHPDGTVTMRPCRVRPRFYRLNDDRFLQTLLVTTSYSGGRIQPYYGMFYDWQGAMVFQPGVTFVRDPFRLTMDYTNVVGAATGQFGAVRDRDNVRFQVEYVF
jgi:hypothetical protein